MKKGIFNIILLVLLITNTVLSAIIVFAVVPAMKSSNEMVNKVAAAIDLEKQNKEQHNAYGQISIDDTDLFTFTDKFTVDLNTAAGEKSHIAVFKVTLTLDKSNEDYSKYKKQLTTYEQLMRTKVTSIIGKYTSTELNNNKEGILEELKNTLREMYNNSEFIYSVGFSDLIVQ